jgi:hypothetical protein
MRGVHQPLLAEAKRSAEQAGQPLDVAIAFVVDDIDPVSAFDHHRTYLFMGDRIRVGMQHTRHVARLDRIGTNAHFQLS